MASTQLGERTLPHFSPPLTHAAHITLVPVDVSDDVGMRLLDLASDQDPIHIGRSSKSPSKSLMAHRNNAWIDSAVMSREHALLELAQDGSARVTIQDIGSMHGTYVNGRQLDRNAVRVLDNDDIIAFGASVKRGTETFPRRSYRITYTWDNVGQSVAPGTDLYELWLTTVSQLTPPRSSYSVPEASEDDSDIVERDLPAPDRTPPVPDNHLSHHITGTCDPADEIILSQPDQYFSDDAQIAAELSSIAADLAVIPESVSQPPGARVYTVPESDVSSIANSLFDGDDQQTVESRSSPTLLQLVADGPGGKMTHTEQSSVACAPRQLFKSESGAPTSARAQKLASYDDSEEEPELHQTRSVVEVVLPENFGVVLGRDSESEQARAGADWTEQEQGASTDILHSDGIWAPAPRSTIEGTGDDFCLSVESAVDDKDASAALERAPSPSDAAMQQPSLSKQSRRRLDNLFSRIKRMSADFQETAEYLDRSPAHAPADKGCSAIAERGEIFPTHSDGPCPPDFSQRPCVSPCSHPGEPGTVQMASTTLAREGRAKMAIADLVDPDTPGLSHHAGNKRKRDTSDDDAMEDFNAADDAGQSSSLIETEDFPNAQPVETVVTETQCTALDVIDDPSTAAGDSRPRKRVATVAKVIAGAVVTGLGVFMGLALANPDQI